MLKKFLLRLKVKHLEALREQKGQSIIIFTFAFLGLIAMLGLALDLGLVYIEKVKVGRTADAATLAAVTELNNNDEQATFDRAVEYIRLNGYDVGGDTEILVRGCLTSAPGPGNVNETGKLAATAKMSPTHVVTGAVYIPATQPVRATFMIDTGSTQVNPGSCNPPTGHGGNSQRIQVIGQANVHMSFMQFFGFSDVPVEDAAVAENITTLDIVVVFDISGSMEDQTICHDCWVRETYDVVNRPYPGNGYFNPIPYNPQLVASESPAVPNQIPLSKLCTDSPTPWLQKNGTITYSYLTVEAELYSANVGNWDLDARVAGQGFWAIQRGSRGSTFPSGFSGSGPEGSDNQGNRAGAPDYQSSNVCNPALPDGVVCKKGSDYLCNDDSGVDIVLDCSAYIAARPYQHYGQSPGSIPIQNGAAYNRDCFNGTSPFTPTLTNRCWTNDRTNSGEPGYNPFFRSDGPLTEPGPSNVPWVEYDFTPTWTGNTSIWIRAIGGGQHSYTWGGPSPDNLSPDRNGGGASNNVATWRKVVFWQINNGEVFEQNDNNNTTVQWLNNFRDNRAEPTSWRWVRLGSTPTVSGTQSTLKLYQGSPGYKVDKIIFTNDPNGGTGSPPPAMRLKRITDRTNLTTDDGREAFGPPASYGSATREACNSCNPIYGNTVVKSQCSCLQNYKEAKNRVFTDTTFYGSGANCSLVLAPTSMLTNVISMTVSAPEVQPPQIQTRTMVNDLYSGNQPVRSAQEAVKNFVLGNGVEEKYRLKPGFDQVGFVAFTDNVDSSSRAKLQCLRAKNPPPNDPASCYADVLAAVEKHWANGSTNIAEGLREGLEELGLKVGSSNYSNSDCTAGVDGSSCDRGGAAKRVLILMTDGSPNAGSGVCPGGYGDYWEGLTGNGNGHFQCAVWYAQQAAANGVIVYTIGIGGGANRDFLTTIATGTDPRSGGTPVPMFPGTGGQYFPAAKPSDLDGIFRIILTSISVRIVG